MFNFNILFMENLEILLFGILAVIVILIVIFIWRSMRMNLKKDIQKIKEESIQTIKKEDDQEINTQEINTQENSLSNDELFFIKKCQEVLNAEQNYWSHKEYERLHQTLCCRLQDIRHREAEKNKIKVECFELLKYMETFNSLCEMVLKNTELLKLFHKESDEKCLNILQQIIGLSDGQFQNKKKLLLEVVHIVKSAEIN